MYSNQEGVDAPAERLARILGSLSISLFLISSIAYMDGRMLLTEIGLWTVFATLAVLSSVVALMLTFSTGRPHGSLPTDGWISREGEGVMRDRLQKEMDEAGVDRFGSNWARMEMRHLESKHSEEE